MHDKEGLAGPNARSLDSVRVIEVTNGQSAPAGEHIINSRVFRLDEVELDVHAYQLRSTQSSSLLGGGASGKDDEEAMPEARVLSLPSREFDGLWEWYVADRPVRLPSWRPLFG